MKELKAHIKNGEFGKAARHLDSYSAQGKRLIKNNKQCKKVIHAIAKTEKLRREEWENYASLLSKLHNMGVDLDIKDNKGFSPMKRITYSQQQQEAYRYYLSKSKKDKVTLLFHTFLLGKEKPSLDTILCIPSECLLSEKKYIKAIAFAKNGTTITKEQKIQLLHSAIDFNKPEDLRWLIDKKGADVNGRMGEDYIYPLYRALQKSTQYGTPRDQFPPNMEVIRILREKDAKMFAYKAIKEEGNDPYKLSGLSQPLLKYLEEKATETINTLKEEHNKTALAHTDITKGGPYSPHTILLNSTLCSKNASAAFRTDLWDTIDQLTVYNKSSHTQTKLNNDYLVQLLMTSLALMALDGLTIIGTETCSAFPLCPSHASAEGVPLACNSLYILDKDIIVLSNCGEENIISLTHEATHAIFQKIYHNALLPHGKGDKETAAEYEKAVNESYKLISENIETLSHTDTGAGYRLKACDWDYKELYSSYRTAEYIALVVECYVVTLIDDGTLKDIEDIKTCIDPIYQFIMKKGIPAIEKYIIEHPKLLEVALPPTVYKKLKESLPAQALSQSRAYHEKKRKTVPAVSEEKEVTPSKTSPLIPLDKTASYQPLYGQPQLTISAPAQPEQVHTFSSQASYTPTYVTVSSQPQRSQSSPTMGNVLAQPVQVQTFPSQAGYTPAYGTVSYQPLYGQPQPIISMQTQPAYVQTFPSQAGYAPTYGTVSYQPLYGQPQPIISVQTQPAHVQTFPSQPVFSSTSGYSTTFTTTGRPSPRPLGSFAQQVAERAATPQHTI